VFTRNILRRPPRRRQANTSQNRRLRISPEFPIFLRFLLCSRNIIVGRRKQGRVSWLRLVALRRARLSIQDERRVRGAAGDRPHRAAIPMCVDLFLPPFVLRFVSKIPVVKIAAFPWNPEKYRWAELSFEISTRRFLSSSRNLLRCHLISIFFPWVHSLCICVIVLLMFPCLLTSLFSLSLNHAVELKKQISCGLHLSNKSDEQVAFKVNKRSSQNVLRKKV
jgi:hypothetical protein